MWRWQGAVAAKPRLLLLDEPTSALDPEYTTEVLNIIHELKKEGMDFIIVTHEMGFARHTCDKVAFLCEGTLMEYMAKVNRSLQGRKQKNCISFWESCCSGMYKKGRGKTGSQ